MREDMGLEFDEIKQVLTWWISWEIQTMTTTARLTLQSLLVQASPC